MTEPTQNAEWLAWRNKGLGASDIAAAFTRSYGNTPRSIVAKKLGIGPEFEPTAAMQGHDWEARIAQAVEALTGYTVAGEQTWLASAEHPWMRATVDGFLLGHPDDTIDDAVGLLEIKTTERANWAYYAAQVQWQMLVAGMDRCVVVILDLSDEAQTHDVGDDLVAVERVGRLSLWDHRADRQLQARLHEFGAELWAHVQAGTLPEIEADDYDAIKAENPDATDTNAVDLSHLDDVATGYVRTKAALRHRRRRSAWRPSSPTPSASTRQPTFTASPGSPAKPTPRATDRCCSQPRQKHHVDQHPDQAAHRARPSQNRPPCARSSRPRVNGSACSTRSCTQMRHPGRLDHHPRRLPQAARQTSLIACPRAPPSA